VRTETVPAVAQTHPVRRRSPTGTATQAWRTQFRRDTQACRASRLHPTPIGTMLVAVKLVLDWTGLDCSLVLLASE